MSDNKHESTPGGAGASPGADALSDSSFHSMGELMGRGFEGSFDGDGSMDFGQGGGGNDSILGELCSPEKPNGSGDPYERALTKDQENECFAEEGKGALNDLFIRISDNRYEIFTGFRNIELSEDEKQAWIEKNKNLSILTNAVRKATDFHGVVIDEHTIAAKDSSGTKKTSSIEDLPQKNESEAIEQDGCEDDQEDQDYCPEEEDDSFESDDEESSDEEEEFSDEQEECIAKQSQNIDSTTIDTGGYDEKRNEYVEDMKKQEARHNPLLYRKIFDHFEYGVKRRPQPIPEPERIKTDLGHVLRTNHRPVREGEVLTLLAGVITPEAESELFHSNDHQFLPNSNTTVLGDEISKELGGLKVCIDSTPFANVKEEDPTLVYSAGFAANSCTKPNAKLFDFTGKEPTDEEVITILKTLGVSSHFLAKDRNGDYTNFKYLNGVVLLVSIRDIPPYTNITTNYNNDSTDKKPLKTTKDKMEGVPKDTKGKMKFWMTPAEFNAFIGDFPLGENECIEHCQCRIIDRGYFLEEPSKNMKKCPLNLMRIKNKDDFDPEAIKRELEENTHRRKIALKEEINELVQKIQESKKNYIPNTVKILWGFDGFDEVLSPSLERIISEFNAMMKSVVKVILESHIENHIKAKTLDDGRVELLFCPENETDNIKAHTAVGVSLYSFNATLSHVLRIYSLGCMEEELYGIEAAYSFLEQSLHNHPLKCIDISTFSTSCTQGRILPISGSQQSWVKMMQDNKKDRFRLKHGGLSGKYNHVLMRFIEDKNLQHVMTDPAMFSLLTIGFTTQSINMGDRIPLINNGYFFNHHSSVRREIEYLGLTEKNIKFCDCMGRLKCPMNGARISIPEIEEHFHKTGIITAEEALVIVNSTHEESGKEILDIEGNPQKKSYFVEGFGNFIELYPTPTGTPLDTPAGTPSAKISSKKRKSESVEKTDRFGSASKGSKSVLKREAPPMKRRLIQVVTNDGSDSKRAKTGSDDEGCSGSGGLGGDGGTGN